MSLDNTTPNPKRTGASHINGILSHLMFQELHANAVGDTQRAAALERAHYIVTKVWTGGKCEYCPSDGTFMDCMFCREDLR